MREVGLLLLGWVTVDWLIVVLWAATIEARSFQRGPRAPRTSRIRPDGRCCESSPRWDFPRLPDRLRDNPHDMPYDLLGHAWARRVSDE